MLQTFFFVNALSFKLEWGIIIFIVLALLLPRILPPLLHAWWINDCIFSILQTGQWINNRHAIRHIQCRVSVCWGMEVAACAYVWTLRTLLKRGTIFAIIIFHMYKFSLSLLLLLLLCFSPLLLVAFLSYRLETGDLLWHINTQQSVRQTLPMGSH